MKIKCLRDCCVFVPGEGRKVVGYEKEEEITVRKDSELAEVLIQDNNFEVLDKPSKSTEEEEGEEEGDE